MMKNMVVTVLRPRDHNEKVKTGVVVKKKLRTVNGMSLVLNSTQASDLSTIEGEIEDHDDKRFNYADKDRRRSSSRSSASSAPPQAMNRVGREEQVPGNSSQPSR